jgi:hypothetical protein
MRSLKAHCHKKEIPILLNNQIVRDQADIERLENEIRDRDVQKENLIKQTKYQISTLQSQINDFENHLIGVYPVQFFVKSSAGYLIGANSAVNYYESR